ncbi:hypothetical protein OESDEN_04651 [Oesophagostomum dentatum]|uniref:Uncharacterized protein n=1 Tax=Oesophagostomum dentatum TaxID=61180 RepID=A0A0B1TDP8_OESDE|nr:hypothetical protein OESDEN_04651 [Oesophagostomum dentatum]
MLRLLSFIVGAVILTGARGCSSMGGADDNEWIENPVFNMDISPPVGWTYFPAKSSDSYQIWYFVGQSNDSATAKQRANTEIRAAMLEGLTAANMVTYGVEVSSDFAPVQIENPTTNLRGAGPLYGKVEAGAVTQSAVGGGTGDLVFATYTVKVKVTLRNASNTRYKWNIVKNTFMQKLSLSFDARFNGEVTVSKT